MLALSRRINEKILFPNLACSVKVVSIRPGQVRLGIDAPAGLSVVREELHGAVASESREGASGPTNARIKAEQLGRLMLTRLGVLSKGMTLLRRQWQGDQITDAELTFDELQDEVELLQRRLERELTQPAAPSRPKSSRKALLVEDNANERALLASFLRTAGMEVDTAGDGCEALDYLRTHSRPDVMLLDMILPRCDGPTTVRAIRRDPAYAGLPIIGVSGHARDEFDIESGPNGLNGWYQKPFDPGALLRDLDRTLNAPANRLQPATANRTRSRPQAARK
jgi:carbon storage regulator CsrA